MPKVSVIIAVYNGHDVLRRCMDSILAQTLTDIEIICVDDDSKDDSLAILQEYAAKDSRVKPIHQENGGAGAARNTGMQHATGEYLSKVLNKVTLFGAIFLAIVAVSPIVISIFSTAAANSGLALGGTSIIIVVGVALETVRAIEAQMLMRNYKGVLD